MNIHTTTTPPPKPKKRVPKERLTSPISKITKQNLNELGPLSLYFPFHDLKSLINKILKQQTDWTPKEKDRLNGQIKEIFLELDKTLKNVYKYAKRGEQYLTTMSIDQITTTNALSICELEHLNGANQVPNTHDHLQCLVDATKIIEKATTSTIKIFRGIWIKDIIGISPKKEVLFINNKKIKYCEELMVPILALLFKLDHIFRSETLAKASGELKDKYNELPESIQRSLQQPPTYTNITPFQAAPRTPLSTNSFNQQRNQAFKTSINEKFLKILTLAKQPEIAAEITTKVFPQKRQLDILLNSNAEFSASQVFAIPDKTENFLNPVNLNIQFTQYKKRQSKALRKDILRLLNEGSPPPKNKKQTAISRTP